ncbi:MAG: 1-deoxy-D-xylulose-5-phosphate reductoisomerase [Legionellales bacterium]|jgi:1-deoxy-D-xylulose-5-phosphate reductoisomerase|nr:1-deoxy-D-xylulose-5-phosphate reductoisomerase [Legionellales bacterium]|tara:strand:- start:4571 stop:5746 length:1176 start_codon:yes stop_codon:yes gene_type:complete
MKEITILGSTGSIGVNTLDVISNHLDKFNVRALTANTNLDIFVEQCFKYQPEYAVMTDEASASKLEEKLKKKAPDISVLAGIEGLVKVAELDSVDYVMAAIVGAAGLLPTLAAAKSGKRVLLANKEALVMSGKLFMDTIAGSNSELIPIDSEHNAIFQCIADTNNQENASIRSIMLTASGGPFLNTPINELASKTPEQACKHPKWKMGRKISVDSATMMNKGLEIIEASWLFNIDPDSINVVIHPQSIIHSLVEYKDGSVLAQLGNPDMRIPISFGLAWPDRIETKVERLDLFDISQFDFKRPEEDRFPCLRLAREAIKQGGTSSAILNAANEVAVNEFLNNNLKFTDIAIVIDSVMSNVAQNNASTLDVILNDDKLARAQAKEVIRGMKI